MRKTIAWTNHLKPNVSMTVKYVKCLCKLRAATVASRWNTTVNATQHLRAPVTGAVQYLFLGVWTMCLVYEGSWTPAAMWMNIKPGDATLNDGEKGDCYTTLSCNHVLYLSWHKMQQKTGFEDFRHLYNMSQSTDINFITVRENSLSSSSLPLSVAARWFADHTAGLMAMG